MMERQIPALANMPTELINRFAARLLPADVRSGQFVDRIGITFTELSIQRIVGEMPVEGNRTPHGRLHGGASVTLAESLGTIGCHLHAGLGRTAVGVDINATHHRAATSGIVTGIATPLHLGRSLASYQVTIVDEEQRKLCTSRITCMIQSA
ncbi:hotdog fold thioesterase [Streptomyces sp. NPDC005574]|uniref:hotdog fold thioesterase n=1 Tax=Streptomyces sp. NPDC005574 TaxID=3156891 RepID=UPI0033AD8D72